MQTLMKCKVSYFVHFTRLDNLHLGKRKILEFTAHVLTRPPIQFPHISFGLNFLFPNFESKIRKRTMLFSEMLIEHFNTFQTITPWYRGRSDALLHPAFGLVQKCIRWSMAPRGNSFDYTTNRHEITV